MARVSISCAVLLLAVLSTRLQAQVTVSGRVVDENGTGISSVRVALQLAGGASLAASSDLAGNFRMAVPAAGDYEIRAEREGFYVFRGHGQRFDEAHNQITITLNHQQEFPEKVDVIASPPAIDPQQPADHRELNNTEIQSIPYPAPQDYRNALQLLNGVVQDNSGAFHFNGAAADQANYTLDGFNLSNPVTGELDMRVNIDSIQSMDVQNSRFTAENGRGSAGVVDLRTKMGDDRWRLNGTNFVPGLASDSGLHISKWTPRLEISGPIVKGRAWFHNGADAFYSDDSIHGLPRGQNRRQGLTLSDLSRFQVDVRPGNILTGSFLWNRRDDSRTGLSFLNPAETTTDLRQISYMSSLRDQVYFHAGALLDLGFADTRGYLHNYPQGDALYTITPFGNTGNYFVNMDRHFYRQQGKANLFLPTAHFHGSHLLKFGVDVEREAFHQTTIRHDYQVLRDDNSIARYVTFTGSPYEAHKNFEGAQYIQDHWTPRDNLSIEAGLRAEWNEIVRDLEVAPRLAAAWAPQALGGIKFSAGWGVYYDAIGLELVARQQDQMSLATFYLPGGPPLGPSATSFGVNDRALSAPRYQTASLGVERKLPFDFYGKAGYTHRVTGNGFAFDPEVPQTGNALYGGALYTLRNTRRDRYDAADFSLKRTFAGKYEWFAGYTRSSSRTNSVIEYSLENPIFAPQGPGPVSWDAPNRFHMWGWAPLPNGSLPRRLRFITHNTTFEYLLEYRTGFPFNEVDQSGFLVGAPDSTRLPRYFSLNVAFERQFQAAHYLWAWRFGFDNLTNSKNPNFVNNILGTPQFLTYARGQSRAFNVRLRLLGRK